MHVHLCVALWLFSLHPSPVFYFVPPFSFQPFQMFFSEFNERSRSNPLCDFRLVATSDHETPLTDKEFKETIKNARKKLETSVAPAMPCKIMKNCGSGGSDKNKTKLACILEADESTRMRMGNSEPPNHEDHIAGKGENSLQHYNLVHKFIPMPQALKVPAAKAAVDKEWEKIGENFGVELDKSQK